ncbi:MAG: hypothetical protein WC360_06915 [Opitutales bacterium]|jgi:hypothetical protein
MSLRHLPVFFGALALTAAAASLLRPSAPRRSAPLDALSGETPSAAILPLPEALPMPDLASIFLRDVPDIAVADADSLRLLRVEAREASYRLCAFAGGAGFWIVSVEDASGRYHTVRSGDLLPGTSLEFRGMEFRTAPGGAPESVALLLDRSNARALEVATGRQSEVPGPVCVIAVPGGPVQRLREGEQIIFRDEVWTVRRISENPPGAVLTERGGRNMELSCGVGTLSASSPGKQ